MSDDARHDETPPGAPPGWQAWAGWLLGPLAWTVLLNAGFAWSTWSCAEGDGGAGWVVWTLLGVAALVAGAGLALSARALSAARPRHGARDDDAVHGSRFVALVGTLVAGISLVGISLSLVAPLMLERCT